MRISKNAIAFQKAGNTSTFNSTTLAPRTDVWRANLRSKSLCG